MILRWWVFGALLGSGCTFGVALCDSNRDCGPGAACDLSTGVCIEDPSSNDGGAGGGQGGSGVGGGGGGAGGGAGGGSVTPALTIILPARAVRPVLAGTTYEDVPAAWRRDEQLAIALQATVPLSSLSLKVGGVDAVAAPLASCTQSCTGSCSCFLADLSKPVLADLRGMFPVAASGIAPGGQTLTASSAVNVTRIAWRRGLGQPIRSTPAIGADGTLYVGTTGMGPAAGSLYAIAANGQERWNRPLGDIEASATVSAPNPAPQRIFVASFGMAAGLSALDVTGATIAQCPLDKNAELSGSPAAISQGAAFYSNKPQQLIAIRPTQNPVCTAADSHQNQVAFPDGLVSSGASVFFVDDKPNVARSDFNASGWQPYTMGQWPGTPLGSYRNHGLALPVGGRLIGAGGMMFGGTVFQAAVSGNFKFDYGFFPPRIAAAAGGPVVASDGLVLVGVPTGVAAVGPTMTNAAAGDGITTTLALGEGGRLFALADKGSISEWTYAAGKPTRVWSAALEAGMTPAFEASPALDCARDEKGAAIAGRPGMLYAASRAGNLIAVIVDSRGIDTTAQWPKYQKDPRNTGSGDTALAEFRCP